MLYQFKNLRAELTVRNIPEHVEPMDLIVEAVARNWAKVQDLIAWRNSGENSYVTDEMFRRLLQTHIDSQYPPST